MKKNLIIASALLALSLPVMAQSVAVIVNSKNPGALTQEQVSNIFLGKSNDLVGIDLPEGNAVREVFYHKVTGKDGPQLKSYWAKLVFTGGSGGLIQNDVKEAEVAHKLWSGLGVPESQMIFEDASRNTFENAAFTQKLVHPQKDEKWLLITSAYHMPRSIGIFRALGMNPAPYPVDYRTLGNGEDYRPPGDGSLAIRNVETALREWVGLGAYWLNGKTDALFPAP